METFELLWIHIPHVQPLQCMEVLMAVAAIGSNIEDRLTNLHRSLHPWVILP